MVTDTDPLDLILGYKGAHEPFFYFKMTANKIPQIDFSDFKTRFQ
jgi:hypothetical protein